MGTLFRREYRNDPKKGIWWIQYYCAGRRIRESSESTKKSDAERLLKLREGEVAQGKVPGTYFDRLTFDELLEDYLRDYRINKRKSLPRAQRSVNHLRRYFPGYKATRIDSFKIREYVDGRLAEGAAPASVNRELSAMKRAFSLAAKCTPQKIPGVPHIPMLKENNTREGFFEHREFLALRDALPEYLGGFVTFAYRSGWRRTEISCLKWNQIDRAKGIVTLNPGETKNDAARALYLDEEMSEVIEAQWRARLRSEKITPDCDYVFTNEAATGRIKEFRGSWAKACRAAGIGKKLFHDFRRTAVRNMVRAGIPERVAMQISGHKTRSVFDRYNIVSPADLQVAAEKQAAYLKKETVAVRGSHDLATITDFPTKKGLPQ